MIWESCEYLFGCTTQENLTLMKLGALTLVAIAIGLSARFMA